MMEDMADRHVLSKNYKRWKLKYETEQKNGVASLHFKYVIRHTFNNIFIAHVPDDLLTMNFQ